MFQRVLVVKLLLVYYATQSLAETHANCNEDVQLRCPGVDTDSMNFLSVTWYKLNNKKPQGIIRRSKGDKTTQNYNINRLATFGENYSLLLPGVTPEDSGSYQCSITANVGGQNQDHIVDLIVSVCVTKADLTTAANALNTNCSNLLCHKQVEDLPVVWSIVGYVVVGITKIILSIISIWVIQAVHTRSSRQQQHLW